MPHSAAVASRPAAAAGSGTPITIVQSANSAGTTGPATTGAIVTLAAAPTAGNTLILIVKATGVIADYNTPSGFTQIYSDGGGSTNYSGLELYAKVATGSGETSQTPTFANNITNMRSVYIEAAGVEPTLASLIYSAGVQSVNTGSTGVTTFNPAAATTDRNDTLYLCILGNNAGVASITSPWSGGTTDLYAGTNYAQVAYKIVANGASLDTAISWTTSRGTCAAIIPIRGLAPAGGPTATLLASGDKGWETTPHHTQIVTSSVSPGANCALVLLASATDNDVNGLNGPFAGTGGVNETTCVSSGSGPTWTRRAYGDTPPSSAYSSGAGVWTATIGGTDPGSFTVTVDPMGSAAAMEMGSYAWALYKVTGHNTTTPFAGAVANWHQAGNGAVTATLTAAPAAGDVTLALSQANVAAGGSSPGASFGSSFGTWTADATSTGSKMTAWVVGRRTGSTSTSVEFSDVNVPAITGYDSAQAAIIVKAP